MKLQIAAIQVFELLCWMLFFKAYTKVYITMVCELCGVNDMLCVAI